MKGFLYNYFVMGRKTEELSDFVEEVLTEEEVDLYWLDWGKKGARWRLLVYLQSPQGVDMKTCVRISKKISKRLDSSELIERQYDLEVSSPGVERPLLTTDHYRGALNEKVRIKTYQPIQEKRKIEGFLKDYVKDQDGDYLRVSQEEGSIKIPLKDISKASVKADLQF